MSTAVIGVDLALENTGLAVVIDGQLVFSTSFSTVLARKGGEERYLDRVEGWLAGARSELARCLAHCTSREVRVAYESRPFLLGKHRQGDQSAAAVLSYAEALALLRVVLNELSLRQVAGIPPQTWQTAILDGIALTNPEIEDAQARLPSGTRRIKAMVAAAVHRETGQWPANDHAADAAAIALATYHMKKNEMKGKK